MLVALQRPKHGLAQEQACKKATSVDLDEGAEPCGQWVASGERCASFKSRIHLIGMQIKIYKFTTHQTIPNPPVHEDNTELHEQCQSTGTFSVW